jgi:hypothetical protein
MDKKDSQGGRDTHLVLGLETCNYILTYLRLTLSLVPQLEHIFGRAVKVKGDTRIVLEDGEPFEVTPFRGAGDRTGMAAAKADAGEYNRVISYASHERECCW